MNRKNLFDCLLLHRNQLVDSHVDTIADFNRQLLQTPAAERLHIRPGGAVFLVHEPGKPDRRIPAAWPKARCTLRAASTMSLATSSEVMKVPLAVFAFLAFPCSRSP